MYQWVQVCWATAFASHSHFALRLDASPSLKEKKRQKVPGWQTGDRMRSDKAEFGLFSWLDLRTAKLFHETPKIVIVCCERQVATANEKHILGWPFSDPPAKRD